MGLTTEMVATASTPSPEHHALSASMFTSDTKRESTMGITIVTMAFLGSPSSIDTLDSASISQ